MSYDFIISTLNSHRRIINQAILRQFIIILLIAALIQKTISRPRGFHSVKYITLSIRNVINISLD